VDGERWGWEERVVGRTKDGDEITDWRPLGERIGWVDPTYTVYLDPDAVYAIVQRFARDQNTSLPITLETLEKRLDERGFLVTEDRGGKHRLRTRKTVAGHPRLVLQMAVDFLGNPDGGH
jgi:hypothetical protein